MSTPNLPPERFSPANKPDRFDPESTDKLSKGSMDQARETSRSVSGNILLEIESTLQKIQQARPRLGQDEANNKLRIADLEALLVINKVINSTLILDEILQVVMQKAIELLKAERGFLMLLDEQGQLQFKTAHNIGKELLTDEDFKISRTIANRVARTGESIYTADAQKDDRFSKQKSVMELHLCSIMCVPLKSKAQTLGVLYLDNSSEAHVFLQSDLYLFELFAGQASIAIEHAKLYDSILQLERYHEEVINRTPVGIVVLDSTFRITTVNEVAQEILSRTQPTVGIRLRSGTDFFELFPAGEREKWLTICQQVLASGQPYSEPRYYFPRGEGQQVLSLKISPLIQPVTAAMGLIVVFEDNTEKVTLENFVILSEKMVAKGEMAAAIGHELNNYLAIISNYTEMLSLNLKRGDISKIEISSKAILENIGKMKRFTDGLMDYTKLETEPVLYDIARLIDDILFSLKPQKQYRHVRFVTRLEHGMPRVEIDVGQMQQVLINLLNNAAEALVEKGAGGTITIEAHALSDTKSQDSTTKIELLIIDDGPGIAPEHIEKIFEPRFTTKKSGHGLGLSTCKRIVENHGGAIAARSTANVGTCFQIVLPVKKRSSS